jgi:SAM-dependent methyltransferase
VGGLLLVAVVDEGRIGRLFVRTAAPSALFPLDQRGWYLTLERARRPAPFRVFSVFAPDDNRLALHGIEQVQGHHGNEIGRYRDLTRLDRLLARDQRLLKLLNAEFVVSPRPLSWLGLVPAGPGAPPGLYRLQGAFPRAFLVGRYQVVPESLALERLLAPDFDPSTTVLLEQPLAPEFAPRADASGGVRWISPGVNRQVLEVEASAPAILVVSDNFYPAWRARIDGRTADLRRANHAFRALPVPAGRHRVEFVYRSGLFAGSLAVSLSFGVLLVGALAWSGVARTCASPAGGKGIGGRYDEEFFADLEGRYLRGTRFARRRVDNVLTLLPPLAGRRLVDLGTGMGTFTIEARRRGAFAAGIDLAPAALAAARRVAAATAVPGVFVRADAAELPIGTQSVDVVLLADVAEHLDDVALGRALREAKRVLRDGGSVVIYAPNRSHVFEWLRARRVLRDGDPSHIGMRTEAQLVALVRGAGLRVRSVRYLPSHLPGWSAIERALASRVPWLRRRLGVVATKEANTPAA